MWGICVLVAIVLLVLGIGIFFMFFRPMGQSSQPVEVQRCDYKQENQEVQPVSLMSKSSSHTKQKFEKAAKHRHDYERTSSGTGIRSKNGGSMKTHILDLVHGKKHHKKQRQKLEQAMQCLEQSGLGFHGNPPDLRYRDDEE